MRERGDKPAAQAPGIGAVIPESGILTDPHCLLTRAGGISRIRVPGRHDAMQHAQPANYMTSRKNVNTTIPTTMVPSMVRRHKNQPRPASAA
ncbi:hypothetical protein LMG9964_02993 [Paraburkholderia phenoliruptrix]|uniref:Uncharacterized protein n=1 Tax=Paraburkholderia phenoliruptrix TaxID=252970 RepID=A0A6J5K8M8_9BURK|nr:hypothetical protein LMG9964_02993 [Paraburkholderia phenoliruptrix]